MDSLRPSEHAFRVLSNDEAAEGIRRLTIASPVAKTLMPGQFMNLRVPGDGSQLLRLPLSFARADAAAGTVVLLYAVVGEGTERLSRMRPGEESTLVGPSGRGWALPKAAGRALLVAGGIGLPPVLACARMLAEARVGFDVCIGSRSKGQVLWDDEDALMRLVDDGGRIVNYTDDGSAARKGFATDGMAELLAERSYAQAYACGPAPMLATVARLARERGLACQVSLERMMGCGFGACSCCNVELAQGGYALCCQDGPVFDAEEVAW